MTSNPSQINADRSLASVLAERGKLAAGPALALIHNLALLLDDLHVAGMIHGSIFPKAVLLNDQDAPRLESPAPGTVLKFDDDWAGLFPELSRLEPLPLPVTLDAARQVFQDAGIRLDPRQIDLCQLGSLWCRLLTGESAGAYLRSPRVKGLVPAGLCAVLERALGANGREAFVDAREFGVALQAVAAEFGPPPTISGTAGSRAAGNPSTGDTTPSRISTPNQPADTSVAPGQSPEAGRTAAGRESAAAHDGLSGNPDDALPFTRLGLYEILRRIGRGGMGDVYLGYEPALERNVAIKVLPADMARSDDFVRRFRSEATAVAKLNHPNIVPIYSIGEDQGHHFYVMQFVEGESLAERLSRQEWLGVNETLQIVEQALAGLAAAHDHGMVHRDIKPGNILLDSRSGRALLADFGLVKSLDSSASGKTATGVVMGTMDYISPEQGRGLPVDARSDLYSIGVMLYRMLSGRLPFTADNPTALIFQHVYETAPPLARVAPHVPVAVAAVIEKLLAKSPAERHQTAVGLSADLRALRTGQPLPWQIPATRPHPTTIIRLPSFDEAPVDPPELPGLTPPRWWEQARDRVESIFRRHAPEVLQQLQNTQQQVDGAVAVYERRQREIEQLVHEARSVLAELQKQSREQRAAAAAAGQRAQSAASAGDAVQAQEEEAYCLRAAAELDQQVAEQQEQFDLIGLRLSHVQAKAQELRNQRDILRARLHAARAGRHLAIGAQRSIGRARRWALRVALILPLAAVVLWITWKFATPVPNASAVIPGTALDAKEGPQVSAGASRTGTDDQSKAPKVAGADEVELAYPIRRFVGHQQAIRSVAIRPDGRLLASSGDEGIVRTWDPETAAEMKAFDAHAAGVRAIAFGPGGEWIVTGGGAEKRGQRTLKIWNPVEGREIRTLTGRTENVAAIAVSSDNKTVAALYTDGLPIAFWDVIAGREERSIDPGIRPSAIAFSPDGLHLALAGNDREVRLWDRVQNEVVLVLKGHERPVTAVAYSSDAARLFSGDDAGTVILWDLKTARPEARLSAATSGVTSIMLNAKGRRLALICGKTAAVWDLDVMHARKKLMDFPATDAAYFADGRTLVAAGSDGSLVLWDGGLKALGVASAAQQIEVAADSQLHAAFTTTRSPPRLLIGGPQLLGAWDFESRSPFQKLETIAETITAVAVSPDGRLAASADNAGTLSLWKIGSGATLLRRMNVPAQSSEKSPRRAGSVRCLAITPQASAVLVVTADSMFLWDVASGSESHVFPGVPSDCRSTAISPEGRYVAVGAWDSAERANELRVWDVATGRQMPRLIGDGAFLDSLLFLSENRLLAGGSDAICMWDIIDARPTRVFQRPANSGGSTEHVVWSALAGSSDGRHLLAGGKNALSLWDVETGEELLRFGTEDRRTSHVTGVSWGEHATSAVSIGLDGNIRIWPLPLSRFQSKQPTSNAK